jgi:hypothetical protein
MASPTVDIGTGTTYTFAGFDAEVKTIDWSGIERVSLETTQLNTPANGLGSRTFIGGDLSDGGTVDMTFHFNPDDTPPIEGSAGTLLITFGSGATWSASAFLTSVSFGVPTEEIMEGTASFKVTGQVTITPAV